MKTSIPVSAAGILDRRISDLEMILMEIALHASVGDWSQTRIAEEALGAIMIPRQAWGRAVALRPADVQQQAAELAHKIGGE